MKKGDRVMLFTDGLFEVEDASGTVFTEEQLPTTVARYAALPLAALHRAGVATSQNVCLLSQKTTEMRL
jgi:serine phosphatase RsbU (regulator of sigma subunit)